MTTAPDKTAPFELGAGDDACLLLHGFTGSPWDIRPLGDALAARGFHVFAPRLPGHGQTPEAMLTVNWRDWERAAEEALVSLKNFRAVFVAGLSMGALLGLILAAKHGARLRGLALVAPAVRFKGPTMALLRSTRAVPWLPFVMPWVSKTASDISDAEVLAQAPLLPRFPAARLNDLWKLQDLALEALPRVSLPTLVVVATQDHVVDPKAGAELVQKLTGAPRVNLVELAHGFHIIPRDKDAPALFREVGGFFESLRA